jgi:hypothetical protein
MFFTKVQPILNDRTSETTTAFIYIQTTYFLHMVDCLLKPFYVYLFSMNA